MSTTQVGNEPATAKPGTQRIDLKLEVVVIPVSDFDRARRFYDSLGWRLDADFSNGDAFRGVQLTPPGSPCSIHFGKGLTAAPPGSAQVFLVVEDIEAARAELVARGVAVSDVSYTTNVGGPRLAGRDPQRNSYASTAAFKDPDGNTWILQEVTRRLPGRGLSLDVTTMTELLREAEEGHGKYEPTAPKHHWSSWYAAYIVSREQGNTPEDAARAGARHTEAVR